ncbi:MAG: macro domain-containing protein [Lachnospiraceae bacterium]
MPLKIIRNDITKVKADIIVNSANPKPVYANGTDAAIYEAAGKEQLLAERKQIGNIEVGNIAVTHAFKLPAKYIIHTAGPDWQGGNSDEFVLLKSCYSKSLQKALELGAKSIAFPLVSTGVYQFPRDKALQTAIMAISEFLFQNDMLVILVVFDKKSFELSGKLFQDVDEYIDEYDVADMAVREYQHNRMEENYKNAVSGMMPGILYNEKKKDLNGIIENHGDTFQECLLKFIARSGMSDPEVYKKANIDRKLFSKIRCNVNYTPRKKTVLAFAVALGLDLKETNILLKSAGLSFSPGSKFDLITEYFIKRKIYNINTINLALFEHGQQTLGA